MRDVVASYETLICLFERAHLFLERLNCYTGIPLTTAMTELLGKIMAQVLSILALATKEMNERRISEPIHRIYIFLADDEVEKFFKRIIGRTDIEDALQRLDTLTKEESLMTAARNLEVTHHVDDNVAAVKELTQDVRDNVKVVEKVTRRVGHGAKCLLIFVHFLTFIPAACQTSNGPATTSVTFSCYHRLLSALKQCNREPVTREAPIMALSS